MSTRTRPRGTALIAGLLGTLVLTVGVLPAAAVAASPALSPSGVGVIKLGMTSIQATGALPPGLIITSAPAAGACVVWQAGLPGSSKRYLPRNSLYATTGHRLTYIVGDTLTTTKGIRRGSTLAAVKRAYGPHLHPAGARPLLPTSLYTNYYVPGTSRGSATMLSISIMRSTGKVAQMAAGTDAVIRTFRGCQ